MYQVIPCLIVTLLRWIKNEKKTNSDKNEKKRTNRLKEKVFEGHDTFCYVKP